MQIFVDDDTHEGIELPMVYAHPIQIGIHAATIILVKGTNRDDKLIKLSCMFLHEVQCGTNLATFDSCFPITRMTIFKEWHDCLSSQNRA